MNKSMAVATQRPLSVRSSLAGRIKAHPLVAYFVGAFAFTWLLNAPAILSRTGLNLLPVTMPAAAIFVLFLLSDFAGPALSAVIVTAAVDGRAGLAQLAARLGRWRVGAGWYLVALFGQLAVDLLGYSVVMGATPWQALVQKWPLLLTTYLGSLLTLLFVLGMGEEIGWRGFALPRLQARFGPLSGTLILGALHGLWHIPFFFVPGAIATPFSPGNAATLVLGVIVSAVVFTWLANGTRGSILLAILFHAALNARISLEAQLLPGHPQTASLWAGYLTMAAAVAIVVLTRGRLGYGPEAK